MTLLVNREPENYKRGFFGINTNSLLTCGEIGTKRAKAFSKQTQKTPADSLLNGEFLLSVYYLCCYTLAVLVC